ncbi:GerAB/ArcD/ProY family transporter [Bacillus weihaiensis]|uniref:Spore gernimation protein KC n=1 Tax=Bacillus weihaiensis TaxID=1547283 RepID=A0A1L3MVN5_9BACI|nr:endospore germination permease [Bacillus weihaiensis]APH06417.1 spore gernimation protein KC [Bacillus weihaiensis]
MNKIVERISLWQLYIVIVCFQIGSAALVGIGNQAKQDAWIAVLLATFIGIGTILFYVFLLSRAPGKNLFELFDYCFGKYIGKALTFVYVIFFFYTASRVLRDFCELLVSTIFEETPIELVAITMMLVIVYMLQHGLEVLGRTSEVFFPYVVTFIVLIGLGILFSGGIEFDRLLPILPEGFTPIMKAIFPDLLTFPFGEVIAFALIIPYVGKEKHVKKVSAVAVLTSGLLLTYGSVVQITTLGADLKERSSFPLLSASREISLLNFIERVDLVVVFFVMFGIIVKVSVFFYGGLKGLEHIMNRPYRTLTFSMGTIIAFFSIIISGSFVEHLEEGLKITTLYFHLPTQFFIPIAMLPILIWKTRKKQQKKETSS